MWIGRVDAFKMYEWNMCILYIHPIHLIILRFSIQNILQRRIFHYISFYNITIHLGGVLGFWGGVCSLGTMFLMILLSQKYCCVHKEVSSVLVFWVQCYKEVSTLYILWVQCFSWFFSLKSIAVFTKRWVQLMFSRYNVTKRCVQLMFSWYNVTKRWVQFMFSGYNVTKSSGYNVTKRWVHFMFSLVHNCTTAYTKKEINV